MQEKKLEALRCFGLPICYFEKFFGPELCNSSRDTSPEFLNCVAKLRRAILEVHEQQAVSSDLSQWLKASKAIWDQTEDFTGLFKYKSLKEKQLDLQISQEVSKLIQIHFVDQEQRLRDYLQTRLQSILEDTSLRFEIISSKMADEVERTYRDCFDKAVLDFDDFAQTYKIGIELKDKAYQGLKRSLNAQIVQARVQLDNSIQDHLVRHQRGNLVIQEQVALLLANKTTDFS